MAIHENLIDRILNLSDPWELKTGEQIEDFVSRRFLNPLHPEIEYSNQELRIKNPEGEVIAKGLVTVVPPTYNTTIDFTQLKVNGDVYDDDVEINYTESATFVAGINVKTYYESSGNIYNLSNKVSITFYIEGTTDLVIVPDIVPNKNTDDTLQYLDITPLFLKNLQGAKIKATVSANGQTDTAEFKGSVTVHKIDLSISNYLFNGKTVVFNIAGLKSIGGMQLQYFDVALGVNPENVELLRTELTGTSTTELVLSSTGAHQIVARIANSEGTFYSNWVQANVVAYDSKNPEAMLAIIGGVPTTINNCENANLYKIIYAPGLGGDIEIVSYLTDEPGNFDDADWSSYVFNRTSISTTSNDAPNTQEYFSYIELTLVGNAQKALAFTLKVDGVEYPIYLLSVNPKGQLYATKYFTLNIKENPYNINNVFNYTEGARDDFSQITGQSTALFNEISSDIEASDGWIIDESRIAYKVSGLDKNLFTLAKDFSTLINSGLGFSIEIMLKNYNINGDDPIMNIGKILFGPGYARVDSEDKSEEGVYVNSRADFEKDTITHLMFVFDPNYKPTTYLNIYDLIFDDGMKYSDITRRYSILKVYVNGCINREIEISAQDLQNEDGFKWLVCPKSSDVNFYIFRTYTRALTYEEIKKNHISSRATSKEKKEIYDRNDILASDGSGRISFYKSMLKHNVIVFVLPPNEKPLFYGNRKTAGDGKSKATVLVRYKDPAYKDASGRFTDGKYKAQGSSAKKYMFHNTQYSEGNFLSEDQIKAGITEGINQYALPTDPEGIKAKKLVGKVNYASSMQSHKMGAIKLYDSAYKEIFPSGTLYNGGKKACLEEAFMYFYYNVKDESELNTITMEDLYTTQVINNIVVAEDSDVKFLGFLTWGSAKADDPTYGYDEDETPEYVLFEGADNASPGANFKQPWAAFQTWTSTMTKAENQNTVGAIVLQPKAVTENNHVEGLLIQGETIQFENDTDPFDVDYGVDLYIAPGQTKDDAKAVDLWVFKDAVKNNSLPYFVKFYNNCYQYDFTNIILNPNENKAKFDVTNTYEATDKRIYMTRATALYEGDKENGQASALDLFRWDAIKQRWVPAGLHYVSGSWETYNLMEVYKNLKKDPLYLKYKDNKNVISEDFSMTNLPIGLASVETYIIPAFKDMFRATVEEYCDKDDIAYHQAFIKLVSGTDNRAKNTYFQIIGKLYLKNEETGEFEKTDVGDYKIRLMQDDLDTIFATDNNGQQVKPYYLLEPSFNKDTEELWGDEHSAFFYPFDVCYYELVNTYLEKLIKHLFGTSTSIKAEDSKLYEYFFKVQKDFPEIAYNHHAEIYYEMPQVIFFHDGVNSGVLKQNGQTVFPNILNEFVNNNVKNPLSLSHGRCLESEYQFMKDRLVLLGTSTTSASGLYTTNEISLSTEATGGSNKTATFSANVEFTDYLYPVKSVKTSNGVEYTKIGNVTKREDTTINFDDVFTKILQAPGIPAVVSELVTPNKEFNVSCDIGTTMGAYLSASDKYKSIVVKGGLDYVHSFLNLPNAESLVIDGVTTHYSVTDSNIVVVNYLPIIENLVITNTTFTETTLDLRGCNRLVTLNLSGCTGIVDIIFPENNRLTNVYLPSGIKKLTLGKNPNLSNFVFAEGTYLTEISLDCSSFNVDFDYMDILNNKIDYSNLKQFILKNTPESGLKIDETVATRLAQIKNNSAIVSLISGKFLIHDRIESVGQYNVISYSWGDESDISYNTKKYLVNAFGNIDSTKNSVYFRYKESTLLKSSAKISELISIDSPSGGTYRPFDSLYFTTGNNVGITDYGRLNILYTVSGLPNGCTCNPNTGELIITHNTNTKYDYKIIVTLTDGTSLPEITGKIYLGYIEPAVGDFAYADGTFSSLYDTDKSLVGMVFQKEVVITGLQWKLGILSCKAINDYAGPDYYHWNSGVGQFSDLDTNQNLASIYTFMKNSAGLNIEMSAPTADKYLGFESGYQTSSDSTKIDYEYLTSIPTKLVQSGKDATERLAFVGLQRLKTLVGKGSNTSLVSYLKENGFLDNLGEFTNSWTHADLDGIYTEFTNYVKSIGFLGNVQYYQVLHPLAIKASLYQPNNLSNKGIDYYSKGSWYIPSIEELELLIWYRIRSTATELTPKSEDYWNSTNYSGDSIFSDTSTYFSSFLDSTMLAANVSTSNKNFVYGENSVYSGGSYVTNYGWYNTYIPGEWYGSSHINCRRDLKYSIAPCCIITVNKEN